MKTSEQAEPGNGLNNMCLVSGRVAKGTTFDRIVSADGDHNRAQNASDSQVKMISMHSYSKKQNSDGTTSIIKEGEGHKNSSHDYCGEKTVTDGSEKDIIVDPPSFVELTSDGGALNVSDKELSMRFCGNLPLHREQTFDRVSFHDEQVPIEVLLCSCHRKWGVRLILGCVFIGCCWSCDYEGSRVLALVCKTLPDMIVSEARSLVRDVVESGFTSAGFVVINYPIRSDPASVLSELKGSSHDLMITGDQALTACRVANQVHVARVAPEQKELIMTTLNSGKYPTGA